MGLLSQIFGPGRDEVWSQIAYDIEGEYIDGGFWHKDTLHYQYKEWTILLDTYTDHHSGEGSSTTYTRLRVPFINKDKLSFNIYREGFFSSIGRFFGMQDIIIGDKFFDEGFVVQGNDEDKIKQLLDSDEVKRLLGIVPNVHIEIRRDDGFFGNSFPKGVDQLYFETMGIITEREVLFNLFQLFSTVLDRLVRIDSAYEDDPKIILR